MPLQHRVCVLLRDNVSLHQYPEGCGFHLAASSPFLAVFLQWCKGMTGFLFLKNVALQSCCYAQWLILCLLLYTRRTHLDMKIWSCYELCTCSFMNYSDSKWSRWAFNDLSEKGSAERSHLSLWARPRRKSRLFRSLYISPFSPLPFLYVDSRTTSVAFSGTRPAPCIESPLPKSCPRQAGWSRTWQPWRQFPWPQRAGTET